MRDSKKGVLVLGLTVAALCAPVNSSFAQVQAHTRMSGPPKPPKTTTAPTGTWLPKSIAYIKASNTGKDNCETRNNSRGNSNRSTDCIPIAIFPMNCPFLSSNTVNPPTPGDPRLVKRQGSKLARRAHPATTPGGAV